MTFPSASVVLVFSNLLLNVLENQETHTHANMRVYINPEPHTVA